MCVCMCLCVCVHPFTVNFVAPWCSGYHYCTTSFNYTWTQVLRRFKSCSRRVGDLWWWGSLTMVPAGNKAKCLSLVNHTSKTIYHHQGFIRLYELDCHRIDHWCCDEDVSFYAKSLHCYFRMKYQTFLTSQLSCSNTRSGQSHGITNVRHDLTNVRDRQLPLSGTSWADLPVAWTLTRGVTV